MRPGPGLVVMALAFISGARRGSTSTSSTITSSSSIDTIRTTTTPTPTTAAAAAAATTIPTQRTTTTAGSQIKKKKGTTTSSTSTATSPPSFEPPIPTIIDTVYGPDNFHGSPLIFSTFLNAIGGDTQTSLLSASSSSSSLNGKSQKRETYPFDNDFNHFYNSPFAISSSAATTTFPLPEHLRLHYDDPRGRIEATKERRYTRSIESATTDDRTSDIVGRAGGTDVDESSLLIEDDNDEGEDNSAASSSLSAATSEGLLVQFPSKSVDSSSRSFVDEDDIFALVAEEDLLSEESFDRFVKLTDDEDKIGYINEDDYSGIEGDAGGTRTETGAGVEGNIASAVDVSGAGGRGSGGSGGVIDGVGINIDVDGGGEDNEFVQLDNRAQQDDGSQLIDENINNNGGSSSNSNIINNNNNNNNNIIKNAADGNAIYAAKLIGHKDGIEAVAQSVVESEPNPTANTLSKRKDLRRSIFETASPLARLNPWISACDLAQPGTATDLQGQCSAGTLPMAWVDEGPGPPTCPKSCDQIRNKNKNKLNLNNNNNNNKIKNLIKTFDNKIKYFINENPINYKSNNVMSDNKNYNNNNFNKNYMKNINNKYNNNNNNYNSNSRNNKDIMTKVRRDVYEQNIVYGDGEAGSVRTPMMMVMTATATESATATVTTIASGTASASVAGKTSSTTTASATTRRTTTTRTPSLTIPTRRTISAGTATKATIESDAVEAGAPGKASIEFEAAVTTTEAGMEIIDETEADDGDEGGDTEIDVSGTATTTAAAVAGAGAGESETAGATTINTPDVIVNKVMQQDAEASVINRQSQENNNIEKATSANNIVYSNNYDLKYNYLRREKNEHNNNNNNNNNKYQTKENNHNNDEDDNDNDDDDDDDDDDEHQCLDYLGDTAETSPTHLCSLKSSSELVRRLRTLRLRHCCERNVFSAMHTLALNATLSGGTKCVRILSDIMEVDTLASRITCELAEILFRFDCRQVYSLINQCDDCKEAYRRWVCSTLVPYFAEPSDVVLPPVSSANTVNVASGTSQTQESSIGSSVAPAAISLAMTRNDGHQIINTNNKSNRGNYERIKRSSKDIKQNQKQEKSMARKFHDIVGHNKNLEMSSLTSDGASDTALVVLKRKRDVKFDTNSRLKRMRGAQQQQQMGREKVHQLALEEEQQQSNNFISTANNNKDPRIEDLNVISNRLKRSKRKAEFRKRRRIRPCLSVCQVVEQKCPYLLPADRAPALPTQYAGEPTFLCLDQNILETGEQLRRSTYGPTDCCYSYCGAPVHGICAYCDGFIVPLEEGFDDATSNSNVTRRVHNFTLTVNAQKRPGGGAASVAIALKNSTTSMISELERLPFYAYFEGNYFYDEDIDDMPEAPLSGACDVVPSVTSRCTIPYYASSATSSLQFRPRHKYIVDSQYLLLWLSTLMCLISSCSAIQQLRLRLGLGMDKQPMLAYKNCEQRCRELRQLVKPKESTATVMKKFKQSETGNIKHHYQYQWNYLNKVRETCPLYDDDDGGGDGGGGNEDIKDSEHKFKKKLTAKSMVLMIRWKTTKAKKMPTKTSLMMATMAKRWRRKPVQQQQQQKQQQKQKLIIDTYKFSKVHFSGSKFKLNRRQNRRIFNYRNCNINLTTIKDTYSSNSCNNRNYRYFYYYNYNINDWWRRWWWNGYECGWLGWLGWTWTPTSPLTQLES